MDAVLQSLVQEHGMGSHGPGEKLIFGGCSAGGRGGMFSLDYVPGILAGFGATEARAFAGACAFYPSSCAVHAAWFLCALELRLIRLLWQGKGIRNGEAAGRPCCRAANSTCDTLTLPIPSTHHHPLTSHTRRSLPATRSPYPLPRSPPWVSWTRPCG